jgi:phospholipid-binding lipoprotein MlaA
MTIKTSSKFRDEMLTLEGDEVMKIVNWTYVFVMLCLTCLATPCLAEIPTSSSPPEASILSSDEDHQMAVAMEPPEILGGAESSESFHPLEPSISSEEPVEAVADPIEPVNRAFFHFNDKLYFWVLKPVATGYKAVIPEDGRIGVRNFFSNLTTPVRLVNCLLQANPKCAGVETLRFALNTTIGVAGLFDPAKKRFNLEKQDKDFGQTLGIWGMGPVFYIDLPILGPSSLRDGLGYAVDTSFNPQTYLAIYSVAAGFISTGGWVLDKINEASLTLGEYEDLKKAALDPYIALREAYSQYRQNKIRGK